MKGYFSWLNTVPHEGEVLLMILNALTFVSLGILGGVFIVAYVYLSFYTYGLFALLPLVCSYWYYRKYVGER